MSLIGLAFASAFVAALALAIPAQIRADNSWGLSFDHVRDTTDDVASRGLGGRTWWRG